jgi:amino acid transporter
MATDLRRTTPAAPEKGLKTGALGLLSSVVIGVASTAPAYSIAASLGFVVAAVGLQSPAIMIVAFIPMLFIAAAYYYLNRAEPDCGTTFCWVTRAMGPRAGWMGGWAIIVADVVVMASLSQIAGIYTFLLFGAEGLAENTFWVTVVGVIWIAVMTWICYIGIEISARSQAFLLSVELFVLGLFSVVALWKVYVDEPEGSIKPAWDWINPFAIESTSALVAGVLVAIFIYWGWDTTVAVNEETADSHRNPGRGALIDTLILVGTYVLVSVAAQAYAGPQTLIDNSDDVLSVVGGAVFGSSFFDKLLIISVLTSAAASTQTTILPTARTSLSMAWFKAAPKVFGRIHPQYLTPTVSTVAMGAASILFYVSLTIGSEDVLFDSIAALGLMIAFYYGITGYACAIYFRRIIFKSAKNFFFIGLAPLLGGVSLTYVFVKSCIDLAKPENSESGDSWFGVGPPLVLGLGLLLLGVVLMFLHRRTDSESRAFFSRRPETAPDGILEAEHVVIDVRDAATVPATAEPAGSEPAPTGGPPSTP